MWTLKAKKSLAEFLEFFKFNDFAFSLLNKWYRNNYIRVVNYHETYPENLETLKSHMIWYEKNFENCSLEKLDKYFNEEHEFTDRPGLIISFDDGFEGNYECAYPLLKQHGFTGYFCVSVGLVGQASYMNKDQLKELIRENHVLCCHTYTHHRMEAYDDEHILKKEILEAKTDLEAMLDTPCRIFSWVGGEENHYTKKAADLIRSAGYDYSLMNNSEPVSKHTNPFQINRTNINDDWKLGVAKFQLAGFMDMKYTPKRKRVNRLTKGVDSFDTNDR